MLETKQGAIPTAEGDARTPGAFRSTLVTFGPSAVLQALLAASTVAAVRGVMRRAGGRFGEFLWLVSMLGAVAPWAYLLVLRPRILHWGATEREINGPLPGDELLPKPTWESTRAIDIAGPVEMVWPWLAQMGQDKGWALVIRLDGGSGRPSLPQC
jgi:hypothetical protein